MTRASTKRATVKTAGEIDASARSLATNVVPHSTTAPANAITGPDEVRMPQGDAWRIRGDAGRRNHPTEGFRKRAQAPVQSARVRASSTGLVYIGQWPESMST